MEKSEVPISKEYLQYKRNYAHNTAAVESAPCAKEHKVSMKCLDRNNFNKELCEGEFENFKICKKFWHFVAIDRSAKGLPLKMTEEEKIQAKEDFAKEVEGKVGEYRERVKEYDKFFKKPS